MEWFKKQHRLLTNIYGMSLNEVSSKFNLAIVQSNPISSIKYHYDFYCYTICI
jgi:hypothetical protein